MDSLRLLPMLFPSNNRFISVIDRVALLVALTVTLIIPLGYFGQGYTGLADRTDRQALVNAGTITALISGNPRLWPYQVQRMEELLVRYPAPIADNSASVYDAQGRRLLSVGEPPAWPVLARSHLLYDSGRVAGRVEITHSLRAFMYETAFAVLLGLLLGWAVYGVLRTWPLRALRRMSVALEAEHADLRASEERYRTVANFTYDWEYWIGPDGSLPYVSPSCLRVTGYQASEFQRDPGLLLRIVHPDDREELDCHLHAIENPELIKDHYELDFRIFTREGEERWIGHVCQPISDQDGKYLGRRACNRDITVRKRTVEALHQSQAALQEAQRIALMGSWRLDVATNQVVWSDELYRMLGLNPELLPPDSTERHRLFTPKSWARLSAARRRTQETGISYELELKTVKADGGHGWMLARGEAIRDASNAIVGLQGVSVDITERKQTEAARASLEAQLRESQKMEAIGTLAGGIAHDFNNIIATILGNAELARQDVSANPLALESLEEIRKAGARARDLVRQILSFSRRQPTERKLTALAPIIEESARLLRATLPARLMIDVHCDPRVPAVLADATQIQQVLINLVTNAMQAMRGGPGRVGIRLDTMMLDAALADAHPALRAMYTGRPGRTVRLAVSDDGPGMDAATLERVFEPFFTTKPVNEGTGLGLSVVHGIVQGHQGAIVVNSQPGKGATFALYLPAAEAQAVAPAPRESAAATAPALSLSGGQHILYIDDDDSLVFLVERLLERSGYRVSGYINPHEALAALRADPAGFDLVVSDYNMPNMSGLDVAREVRAIRADLPVAVASGFIDEALRMQAEGAGVSELIFKTNAAEDFCDVMQRLAQAVAEKSKSY